VADCTCAAARLGVVVVLAYGDLHCLVGDDLTDWIRDEADLLRRCREGSDAAYAVLVRQHRPRLFTLAYRLTGDPSTAEDVVQEAFLAAFKGIDRFEPKPSLAPWLNTITIRIAKRAASRQRARPSTSLDDTAGDDGAALVDVLFAPRNGEGDPHAAAEAAELRRHVAAAIDRLPFNYRAAVVLRHVMGLDYAEAAVSLSVPLNTFKSHLLRGTKMLREELTQDLDKAEPPTTAHQPHSAGDDGHGLEMELLRREPSMVARSARRS
jgi:RNA polymerase sigma-70 factor, ECF subfamily